MPTARVEALLIESDEVSRREIRDISHAVGYEEKYDGGVTLAGGAEDVLIAPPQLSSAKVLILTASDGITVRLNDVNNTAMESVTLLVLAASGLTSLYLSNEGDAAVKVRLHMYGDA